jgi:hypothetical protein
MRKRVRTAEHQHAAAAIRNKFLQQRQLVVREERGLNVVDNDRLVFVQLFPRLREAVAQLDVVARADADDHRLIVRFRIGFPVGVEALEQRVAALSGPAAKLELGLLPRDPDESDQLQCRVGFHGPTQELELPVRPT